MIVEKIKNIIWLNNFDDFESCDLESLTFDEYKKIIVDISIFFSSRYFYYFPLTQVHLLVKFIKLIFEKKKCFDQIEDFHYKILIKLLMKEEKENENEEKKENEEDSYSYIIKRFIIIDCLSDTLSKEKLNFYNQENNTSILKLLLKFCKNNLLLKTLHNKGMDFLNVEGLNPYYYVLKNSDSINLTIETLYSLKVPLPKNYWSYVFKEIIYGRLNEEKNFLLKLQDKQFIVDNDTKECVWNLIIKNKAYHVIRFIPKEFYKPYTLNKKTLLEEIIDANDFLFVAYLDNNIMKLLDNEKDIIKLLSYLFRDKKNIEKFYLKYLLNIMKNFHKLEKKNHKDAILAYKSWENQKDLIKQQLIFFEINDEIIIETLNSLEESNFIFLFELITKYLNKEENKFQNEIENSSKIQIKLFTEESFQKFKEEFNDSKNDVLKNFINKHNNYQNFQNKTLASASNFLEKIEKLYETFPHFEEVIKHIENIMILQNKGDKSFYIPPLLLGGSPGVGKTFFCETISKLVDTNFELLNMESMSANFILTGSNSQWRDAIPGKIFKTLFNKDNKSMNPIFLLDELEKAGGDERYNVINSLLPLLERYTAKNFKDECIPLNIDASYIIWIATANDIDKLTAPIKSRFDIFSVPNPTPNQRKLLIKGIYQSIRNNNTWGNYFSENLPEETLGVLAKLMSPGVARDLRKAITMACSKAVKEETNIILPSHIERYEEEDVMPWDAII